MRFNKQELISLATQPSNKFEKEGPLHLTEKQDGFFRKTEVSFERWCRLRGNLLFYFKSNDPFSEPHGCLVLEKYRCVRHDKEDPEWDGFVFYLEFFDGLQQRFAANTHQERFEWMQAIDLAEYDAKRAQLKYLKEQIDKNRESNREVDIDILRVQSGKQIDLNETPICESVISCDNLLCDGNGKPPSPSVIVHIASNVAASGWIKYGKTEVIERSSNPQFICTTIFRMCDGLHTDSKIRFTAYDVREKVTQTAVPIGWAEIALGVIMDTSRLRIPLRTQTCGETAGFLTIATYTPNTEHRNNQQSPMKSEMFPSQPLMISSEQQQLGHRRSQSLPLKLGIQMFVPPPSKIRVFFTNPSIHSYRLHSGLGGDISVLEMMYESNLCNIIPQQLLTVWIAREKELLQEISGMGELGGEWRQKQMELLDKHLKLLKDYSQAKQYLHQQQHRGKSFKPSSKKAEESIEFAPVNLHLQRMWAHNDTLKRTGILDIITVGAFTRHSGKSKTGGLIKMLHRVNDSPVKNEGQCNITSANDAVQAIKQLRKEIVEIMSQLLFLARSKTPKGMLQLCNEMIAKTRALLNIWEPSLVEDTFAFIEQHRVIDDGNLTSQESAMTGKVLVKESSVMSPFRKITEQLGDINLKSSQKEDFSSFPDWAYEFQPQALANQFDIIDKSIKQSKQVLPSEVDNVAKIQNDNDKHQNHQCLQMTKQAGKEVSMNFLATEQPSSSKPQKSNDRNQVKKKYIEGINFSETHFDINGDVISEDVTAATENLRSDTINVLNPNSSKSIFLSDNLSSTSKTDISSNTYNEQSNIQENVSIILGYNGAFLDTRVMSSSPSANYYRPTEEPEPLDLTQLNIEASVMCLVSKIKFLCGRCGSPAVRLRNLTDKTSGTELCINESLSEGFSSCVVSNQPIPQSHDSSCNDNSKTDYEDRFVDTLSEESSMQFKIGARKSSENTSALCSFTMNNKIQVVKHPSNKMDFNLALTEAVGEVTRKVRRGNKFTDGLDLSTTTDWTLELRPSMKKLRQAMDGLLKTARLMHSVQRLQQDIKKTSTMLATMYHRDVCFSQALTALVTGLMAKLWGQTVSENFISLLIHLGPLAHFEGLLSLYGNETDMWGDMIVAIEDLATVHFTLVRSKLHNDTKPPIPMPRVIGNRQALRVLLPVPEPVLAHLPIKKEVNFRVVPVFFNIGINEKATVAETLGFTRDQHRSNLDNYNRLRQYHCKYRTVPFNFVNSHCSSTHDTPTKVGSYKYHHKELLSSEHTVLKFLSDLEAELLHNGSKNINILYLSEEITRAMQGLRFTSCKSAKDRTSMAVTLEQCRVLQQEFHLSNGNVQNVLDTMRSEGTRPDNTMKNVGMRKYAFNLPQVLSLPNVYRPPHGTYGKTQS